MNEGKCVNDSQASAVNRNIDVVGASRVKDSIGKIVVEEDKLMEV